MAAPNPRAEWDTPELLRTRRYTIDFAKNYREGRAREWKLPSERRLALIESPKPGLWPGLVVPALKVDGRWPRVPLVPHVPDPNRHADNPVPPAETIAKVEAPLRDVFIPALRRDYNMEYKRALGWGGMGVVTAFEVRDGHGLRVRDVAVKISIAADPELVRERDNHVFLARARHVVQMVRLEDVNKSAESSSSSDGRSWFNPGGRRKRRRGRDSPDGAGLLSAAGYRRLRNYFASVLVSPFKRRRVDEGEPNPIVAGRALPGPGNPGMAFAGPREQQEQMAYRVPSDSSTAPPDPTTGAGGGYEKSVEMMDYFPPPTVDMMPLPPQVRGLPRQQPPQKPPAFMGPPRAGPTDEPIDDRVLILEMLSRGNLEGWIAKMAVTQKFFPNRILWLFFECLFKGVVAMDHPPLFYDDFDDTGGPDGPLEEERVPSKKNPRLQPSPDFVHFDLDPLNILVGDFDTIFKGGHNFTPILKIGDLGLGEKTDKLKQDPIGIWRSRGKGKPGLGLLSPEQFSEEWDYIGSTPALETKFKPKIAGQYSWKTNLFQVGLIMYALITTCRPPFRPFPEIASRSNRHTGPGRNHVTVTEHWSYGTWLRSARFVAVDHDLREMVVRCLCDVPADRPALADLWRLIQSKVKGPWPDDQSDLDMHDWTRAFFEKPGLSGPPIVFQSVAPGAFKFGAAPARAAGPGYYMTPSVTPMKRKDTDDDDDDGSGVARPSTTTTSPSRPVARPKGRWGFRTHAPRKRHPFTPNLGSARRDLFGPAEATQQQQQQQQQTPVTPSPLRDNAGAPAAGGQTTQQLPPSTLNPFLPMPGMFPRSTAFQTSPRRRRDKRPSRRPMPRGGRR